MWQRYTFADMRIIGHYLGVILLLGAAAMCAPLAIAVLFHEWDAAVRYVFSIGVTFLLGASLRMLRVVPGHMTRQQAIAVTGFAWIVLALVGAIPLFLSEHYATFSDALFDTVSAFTTTDVTIISNLNHISHADNTWRFVMNFSGGLGLIVVALSLGIFGGMAGSTLYSSEGRSEHVLPNVVQTARFIFRFTLVLVLVMGAILGLVLVLQGMEPSHAFLHGVWLAMSSFMTAGLTPMTTSITYYHSVGLEAILCILMIFGSINFAVQSEIWAGRRVSFYRDTEVRGAAMWWLIMLLVFMVVLCNTSSSATGTAGGLGLPTLMRTGMFTFVSTATTTGFSTWPDMQMSGLTPPGSVLVLTLLMAVGGSAGSTAGGIKIQRLGIIAKSAYETLRVTASAESARIVTSYYHIGRRRLEAPEIREAMTVTILYVAVYLIGSLVCIVFTNNTDGLTAISESVAMASNSGISSGLCYAGMPAVLKYTYIAEMWMGRLEYVALISLAVKIFVSVKPRPKKRRS